MKDTEVKEIVGEEWEKFRDLRVRAAGDSPQAFGDTVEETKNRSEAVWREWVTGAHNYVVEVDNTFIALGTFRKDEHGDWIINGVWTDPLYRNQGISRKILQKILDKAKSLKVSEIRLDVNPEQTTALHLYSKLGFEVVNDTGFGMMGDGKLHPQYTMALKL